MTRAELERHRGMRRLRALRDLITAAEERLERLREREAPEDFINGAVRRLETLKAERDDLTRVWKPAFTRNVRWA